MNEPISVSQLNIQIKSLLETTFSFVYIKGEISNVTYHNSGHIYFSIKDNNSTLSCVMFKGNRKNLKFTLEIGQEVVISGSITVYTPRGSYQLLASNIEPSGVGALALAYEQLKSKLEKKGYFNKDIKKTLPKYPKKIIIITSSTGAAIQDMKKIASNRWPLVKLQLIDVLVQGEKAKDEISNAIKIATKLNPDIIIVGRGGGSIEDLWAFNEECVCDAIYESNIPIISAVGHENDFVISDFVADLRASTPSNAIELALADINEVRFYIDNLYNDFNKNMKIILNNKQLLLSNILASFKQNSIKNKFDLIESNILNLIRDFNNIFEQILNKNQQKLDLLKNSFKLNHPDNKVKDGYVQLTKNSKIVSIDNIKIDDIVNLESSKTLIKSKVLEINNLK